MEHDAEPEGVVILVDRLDEKLEDTLERLARAGAVRRVISTSATGCTGTVVGLAPVAGITPERCVREAIYEVSTAETLVVAADTTNPMVAVLSALALVFGAKLVILEDARDQLFPSRYHAKQSLAELLEQLAKTLQPKPTRNNPASTSTANLNPDTYVFSKISTP